MLLCYSKTTINFVYYICEVNLFKDVQELQHAVSAQQIASPHPYKKDYKEQRLSEFGKTIMKYANRIKTAEHFPLQYVVFCRGFTVCFVTSLSSC